MIDMDKNKRKNNTNVSLNSLLDKVSKINSAVNKFVIKSERDTVALTKMIDDMKMLKDENEYLADQIYYLELDLIKCEQYSRRENIELVGLPHSMLHKNLEVKVVDILNKSGVKVSSYDETGIAWHRLRKQQNQTTAKVIVRFIDRKK